MTLRDAALTPPEPTPWEREMHIERRGIALDSVDVMLERVRRRRTASDYTPSAPVAMNARTEHMLAVRLASFGGPEVLHVGCVSTPTASAGSSLVKVRRAGVNFFDTERRASGWGGARLPAVLGAEVAGIRRRDGQRVVGLTAGGVGGYAEVAELSDALTVPIPDDVTDAAALAVLIQGLTAWHTLRSAARIRDGESVVVTAAAGGVGSMAVQLARRFGAGRVIALASTPSKHHVVRVLGADAVVDSALRDDLAGRVLAANHGRPVDVVLDSVAGSVFESLLQVLRTGGRLVAYGQASGASNIVAVDRLMDHSIGVLGFHLTPYLDDHAGTRRIIRELLAGLADRWLVAREGTAYPIGAAAEAHRAVSAGQTSGKVTLRVDPPSWRARPRSPDHPTALPTRCVIHEEQLDASSTIPLLRPSPQRAH